MKEVYINGVEACRAAFERLKQGQPKELSHMGLDPSKITAAIVSVEAGFDKGYLKKKRSHHSGLIAKIEDYRRQFVIDPKNLADRLEVVTNRANALEVKNKELVAMMQNVVAQNLQLIERVRYLEGISQSKGNVHPLRTD